MKELRSKLKIVVVLLLFMLLSLVLYTTYTVKTYGRRWFSNSRNIRVVEDKRNVVAGNIYDRNKELLRYTDKNGNRQTTGTQIEKEAVVHVLGDTQNQVSNGVEKFQARYIYGYDAGIGERLYSFVRGKKRVGDNIMLTIDRNINTLVAQAFKTRNELKGKNGAVVVMNYKTGEILSLVSIPTFDPNMHHSDIYDTKSTHFFNRATQSLLPPGSTFKVVTMASAVNNDKDIEEKEFMCSGDYTVMSQTIRDAGKSVHGAINLKRALEVSCNNIFSYLGMSLGYNKINETAKSFGFNEKFLFEDIVMENSKYPIPKNDFEMATSAIGQARVLASPMHMCMIASAIANDGVMMEPKMLLAVRGINGAKRLDLEPSVYKKSINPEIAKKIKEAMLGVVKNGTGRAAQVSGMNIAGKTGSAESYMDNKPVTHAWFIGFNADDSKPYAVCVMVEAGGGGGRVAAPLAREIFLYLKNMR